MLEVAEDEGVVIDKIEDCKLSDDVLISVGIALDEIDTLLTALVADTDEIAEIAE